MNENQFPNGYVVLPIDAYDKLQQRVARLAKIESDLVSFNTRKANKYGPAIVEAALDASIMYELVEQKWAEAPEHSDPEWTAKQKKDIYWFTTDVATGPAYVEPDGEGE